ncbi:MAG: UDP-N-acetylmuramate--L-alanine ligase [Microbacteriaceae bacterium]
MTQDIAFAPEFPTALQRVHFIGIGGGGMSGIASLMIAAGIEVSGSDLRDSAATQALQGLGATVFEGHRAENLGAVDAVVVTSAMPSDNPEYLAAREQNLPILHRSQALAWLANRQRLISIAGAHGKSTSTGMMVTALEALGRYPSYVSGAILMDRGNSAGVGDDELFVVEADESDGSFLRYETDIALITNVDADHLDYFGSQENFESAFVEFAEKANELIVISSDDPGAVRVTEKLDPSAHRIRTFGFAAGADYRIVGFENGLQAQFTLRVQDTDYQGTISMPGRHNVLNAIGIVAILVELGFAPDDAISAVSGYGGTQHRFELKGEVANIRVVDDYAHHPTEVTATLAMVREIAGDARVIAIYQPKRYTRTQILAGEFAAAYENGADMTVILDIYPAMEPVIPGISGQTVLDRFEDPSRAVFLADWDEASNFVAKLAEPGDWIISFSSGDKTMIIPQVLDALKLQHGVAAAK